MASTRISCIVAILLHGAAQASCGCVVACPLQDGFGILDVQMDSLFLMRRADSMGILSVTCCWERFSKKEDAHTAYHCMWRTLIEIPQAWQPAKQSVEHLFDGILVEWMTLYLSTRIHKLSGRLGSSVSCSFLCGTYYISASTVSGPELLQLRAAPPIVNEMGS